jgi:hypothetical protein
MDHSMLKTRSSLQAAVAVRGEPVLREHSRMVLWLCSVLSVVGAPSVTASQTAIQGPESRVQLVELFTSEGCSSCPRADATLLDLESHPELWRTFAPIGLHVDYWDQLGWPDRFATVGNGQRQKDYARAGLTSGVYTPGWFVGGQEWRGWFIGQSVPIGHSTKVGNLGIEIDGAQVKVHTTHAALARTARQVYVAIIGTGLTSQVRRGENRGRTLNHAFVALTQAQADFVSGRGELELPEAVNDDVPTRRAVVAWVTRADHPVPLQAVGGWLPPVTAQ